LRLPALSLSLRVMLKLWAIPLLILLQPIMETISHGYLGFEFTLGDHFHGLHKLLLLLGGKLPPGRCRNQGKGNNYFIALPINLSLS